MHKYDLPFNTIFPFNFFTERCSLSFLFHNSSASIQFRLKKRREPTLLSRTSSSQTKQMAVSTVRLFAKSKQCMSIIYFSVIPSYFIPLSQFQKQTYEKPLNIRFAFLRRAKDLSLFPFLRLFLARFAF